MTDRRKAAGIGVVVGILGVVAAVAVFGLIVVYSGAYNVAATEEHTSFVRWAFDTTFQNSIELRAAEIVPPENVTPEMVTAGAGAYMSMCQHCHAGPGVERARWANGMRPQPPHLTEAASHWEIEEVFWLVRHGARMTGMPAFGPTHEDGALWNIAAFVKELPGMTPERYEELGAADGGDGSRSGHTH